MNEENTKPSNLERNVKSLCRLKEILERRAKGSSLSESDLTNLLDELNTLSETVMFLTYLVGDLSKSFPENSIEFLALRAKSPQEVLNRIPDRNIREPHAGILEAISLLRNTGLDETSAILCIKNKFRYFRGKPGIRLRINQDGKIAIE